MAKLINFTEKELQIYKELKTKKPFSKYVKEAFYDKIDKDIISIGNEGQQEMKVIKRRQKG